MEVLCIDLPKSAEDGVIVKIKIGEKYNVTDDWIENDRLYYGIAEDPDTFYLSKLFIPTSDKDETEYVDEILEKIFVTI